MSEGHDIELRRRADLLALTVRLAVDSLERGQVMDAYARLKDTADDPALVPPMGARSA